MELILAMQSRQDKMFALLLAMASGEKFDAAKLAELMGVPAAGMPLGVHDGKVITSGVATGEIKKPIGPDRSGYAREPAKGKAERAKDAADQL